MTTVVFLGLLAMQQPTAAGASGSLSVTVLERGTDAPLADTPVWIILRASGAERRTVRTGPNGLVTVEDLPAGRYTVQVMSDTRRP